MVQVGLELDESLIAIGDFRHAGGYGAMYTLLDHKKPPTAILVCSELMTCGTLLCLKELGVSNSVDLSLLTSGDPGWAKFFSPSISSLRTDRFYMSRLAFDTLLASIKIDQAKLGERS
jgi:DNA-binding LacI/PurR family transcriptional regulator